MVRACRDGSVPRVGAACSRRRGAAYAQARPEPARLTPFTASDAAPGGDVRVGAAACCCRKGCTPTPTSRATRSCIPMRAHRRRRLPGVTRRRNRLAARPSIWRRKAADSRCAFSNASSSIGVRFAIAADVPAGDITVPATLRYQACNDKMCFFPVTLKTSWAFKVGGTSGAAAEQHEAIFAGITFGTGEKPAAQRLRRPRVRRQSHRQRPPRSTRRSSRGDARVARQALHRGRQHELRGHAPSSSSSSGTPRQASSSEGCSRGAGRWRFCCSSSSAGWR